MQSLDEIEAHFQAHGYPSEPVQLDKATRIVNPEKFVKLSLSYLRGHGAGNRTYLPYYERLIKFYEIINQKSKHEKHND